MTTSRDPRVLALLAGREPASVVDVAWARPLRISAYLGLAPLPDDLVISVRCLVTVGDDVVVCTNQKGLDHAWPGGRREPGETYDETASREVREETGWNIATRSITHLGFLHLFNPGDPQPPYPHPDNLQVVVTARATARAGQDWTDVEGYEVSSRLVPLREAARVISAEEPMCVPFLEHLDRLRR